VSTNQQTELLWQINKMLRYLLTSSGQFHVIGGYVYGRTSGDKGYIILYPAESYLKHKAVRVYEEKLDRLPDFIPTDDIPDDARGDNPDKDKAIRLGIYHECQPFEVLTFDGKDTQMGNEIRFGDVLRVLKPRIQTPPPRPESGPATSPPLVATTSTPPVAEKKTPPASSGVGQAAAALPANAEDGKKYIEHHTNEARTSMSWFMLSTAIRKLHPERTDVQLMKVAEMFMQEPWTDSDVATANAGGFLADGIMTYLSWRALGRDHASSKAAALTAYEGPGE